MGDIKSRHYYHDQASLSLDMGQGKRPRKGWPRLQTRSGKGITGRGVRSTAPGPSLHDQQGQPCRNHHSEGRVSSCYSPDVALLLYTRSNNSIYTCKNPPPLETIKEAPFRDTTNSTAKHMNTTPTL